MVTPPNKPWNIAQRHRLVRAIPGEGELSLDGNSVIWYRRNIVAQPPVKPTTSPQYSAQSALSEGKVNYYSAEIQSYDTAEK